MKRLLDSLRTAIAGPLPPSPATPWSPDSGVDRVLVMADVHRGDRVARNLFVRKFGGEPPDFGHHMLAFHRRMDDSLACLGYVHLWTRDGLGYIGGVCTDDRALRTVPREQRDVLQAAGGGVYYHLLRYTFHRFAARLDGYAGYCGDARSLNVSLQAGFRRTNHPYLLFRANRPLSAARAKQLIAQAHAQGPF